jgi:hypothetical protein
MSTTAYYSYIHIFRAIRFNIGKCFIFIEIPGLKKGCRNLICIINLISDASLLS